MRPRRVVVGNLAIGVALALTVSSCTSDGKGSGASPSAPAANRALATSLQSGAKRLSSTHFEITGTVSGQALTGSGDQKLSGGTLTGLQAQVALPLVGGVQIVVDGDKRYAKVPPPLATAAKPWLPVTSGSKNLVVQQLAGLLDAALAAGDLGGLADLADASARVRKVGSEPVAGVAATRYSLLVDPARLPAKTAGTTLGTAKIPVDLWVDAQDRPVRVGAKVSVVGQPVTVTVDFSKFNAPVTISAPPASQIAMG